MRYARGSHRWDAVYRPNLFVSSMPIPGTEGELVPDVDALAAAGDAEVLTFATEPGDVVVHHARTLHAAGGNRSTTTRRRAISVRYCGDDARVLVRAGAPLKPYQQDVTDGAVLDSPDCSGSARGPVCARRRAAEAPLRPSWSCEPVTRELATVHVSFRGTLTDMDDLGHPVFDADNHYYEALDAFTRHLDPRSGPRTVQWAEINGRKYHVVGGRVSRAVVNPTFNPIAKAGAMHDYFRGNPEGRNPLEFLREREPIRPEYRDRDARLGVMDEQGLDQLWLFPTLGDALRGAAEGRPRGGDDHVHRVQPVARRRTGASRTRTGSSPRRTSRSATSTGRCRSSSGRSTRAPGRSACARRPCSRRPVRSPRRTRCSTRSGPA